MHSYSGPERRQHRLFITLHTEYHLKQIYCVGVRDRRSGTWYRHHIALGNELKGAIQIHGNGIKLADEPSVGFSLWFVSEKEDIITSPVIDITRPPKESLSYYI